MKAAPTPSPGKVLLADIGGTNARFAVLAGVTVDRVAHMAVRDHGSFGEALVAYLGGLPEAGRSTPQSLPLPVSSRTAAALSPIVPG